ncbi:MAG: hypothetical protein SVU32_07355, partial [Candidatus Nanohaloarchaea archaeon]|nr:hypothetical protein [Candidatus Nanohaloarchaea archaeon]
YGVNMDEVDLQIEYLQTHNSWYGNKGMNDVMEENREFIEEVETTLNEVEQLYDYYINSTATNSGIFYEALIFHGDTGE